jgi:hypothetical protein
MQSDKLERITKLLWSKRRDLYIATTIGLFIGRVDRNFKFEEKKEKYF